MSLLLNIMLFTPAIGAIFCLGGSKHSAKWIALLTSIITLVMSIAIAAEYYSSGASGVQFVTAEPWISSINVDYRIGIDPKGLSHSPYFRLVACRCLEFDPITGHR